MRMRTHPYVLLFCTGYSIDVELEEEYDTMHIIPVTRTYILSLFHYPLYHYTMDLGQQQGCMEIMHSGPIILIVYCLLHSQSDFWL